MVRTLRPIAELTALLAAAIVVALGTSSAALATSPPAPGTASQVRALVKHSVWIERLDRSVLSELPTASDDTSATVFHLPRYCVTATACVFGDKSSTSTIVLYGDSHARMWLPAVDEIALAHQLRLVLLGRDGCPVVSIKLQNTRFHLCGPTQADVMAAIASIKPVAVLLSNRTSYPHLTASVWQAGMTATVQSLEALGAKVAIIGDIQVMNLDPPLCLEEHVDDAMACLQPNPNRSVPGMEAAEQAAATATKATYVDPTPWLCTATKCSSVIGGFVAYWDPHHISVDYARYLSGVLGTALQPVLPAG